MLCCVSVHQKRPIQIKRDQLTTLKETDNICTSRETYTYQKRPTDHIKKDQPQNTSETNNIYTLLQVSFDV